ncbi:MAG: L,D-transpeptidase [Thermomicrobiales bacterium]
MGRTARLKLMIACFLLALANPIAETGVAQPTLDSALPAETTSFSGSSGLDDLNPVLFPVEFGQTEMTVFVEQTGHTVEGMILDYWRANGQASVYGNPISEPYAAANGLYSQAFERGILQYNPDWTMTDDPWIRLAPIGRASVIDKRNVTRADGRRIAADRRTDAFTPLTGTDALQTADSRVSSATGFSLSGEFASWYDRHEGPFYLGEPISQPHSARGVTTQYFENGQLLSSNDVVWMAPLTREAPEQFGIDTTPVSQGTMPTYSEDMFVESANPYGVDTSDLFGRRSIVISIDDQTLRAYQGEQLVLETLVSTGLTPNDTEVGNFHVRIKRPSQTMSGFTSNTGEVVATGSEATAETSGLSTYEVEDVPHVMYFNYQAEALHGAYWHDNFGNQMSHGCVNLQLDIATFLYEWAPLGTSVTVVKDGF